MEVSGLLAGIAGLAGLFSTCLEGFSFVQSIRSLGRDYDILQKSLLHISSICDGLVI
jgi:hypothetical protein